MLTAGCGQVCAAHPGTITMSTVDVAEMKEKGMGLIYGVGRCRPRPRLPTGSVHPFKLLRPNSTP